MRPERAKLRVRVFAYLIAFTLALSLNAIAIQPGAFAQVQGLDQAKISEFHAKLETAQRTQADLNQRVTCLDQRDAQLVSKRDSAGRASWTASLDRNAIGHC